MKISELLQSQPVQEALSDLAKIAVQAVTTGDLSKWSELDTQEKRQALRDAGYINVGKDDMYAYGRDSELSDRKINQLMQQRQDDAYQVAMGPEKRAELKAKADELAEMQRRQLRQERVEDEQRAYERYKDKAEREDAMARIDKEYKNNLEVINTEHRNNMEAIRTGNKHEIDKITLDHQEAQREREHELEKDQRNNDREDARRRDDRDNRQDSPQDFPEPNDDDKDDTEGEPFRPEAPAGPALAAPKPDDKPSKYDNDDAIDVDFTEVPDDEEDDGKPLALPKPNKESLELARIRQLAGLKENIFTTDYKLVMDAVAKLYSEHYDINIWEFAEEHDDAAKVLMKEHPDVKELEYIIKSGELPERFIDLDFPLNDNMMYGIEQGDEKLGEDELDEAPATRDLCLSGKPNSALGASQLASCKAQGYRARDTGKSQKIGSERVKLRGTTKKSTAYGGPVSPTRTG